MSSFKAKRYATALYEVASDQGKLDSIDSDMNIISELMQVPKIASFCERLDRNISTDMLFLETAFLKRVSTITQRTLKIIARYKRMMLLPFLADAYKQIKQIHSGTVNVTVKVAYEPDIKTKEEIKTAMLRRTGKRVLLNFLSAPELIGGIKLFWENKELDLSLAHRFKKLRQFLKKE